MKGFIFKFVLPLLAFFVSAGSVFGGLSDRINAIVGKKDFAKVDFAIKVIEAKSGKTVYSRNSDKLMIPASNMKIVTSGAAMAFLGKDYKFTTKVGLLDNSVVVIGGGDPLLGDSDTDQKYGRKTGWVFDEIIAGLKEKNVTDVNDVVVDSTFFDDQLVNPSWPAAQLNQPYSCEVSGLNYNENCVQLTVRRVGSRAVVSVEPATNYLSFINQVKLVSSGNSAIGAYRNGTPNRLTLKGKCRKESGFRIAIERPGAMFGVMLKEKLQKAGINVQGGVYQRYVKNNSNVEVFKTFQTPISDVLMRCNKDSLNLAAECLIKTISAEYTANKIQGEWKHGFDLVGRYMDKLGISEGEYVFDDGCGLSRNNQVSVNLMTAVLKSIYNSSNWADYSKSLAIGGVDGTIYKYFREAKYKGKIIGKTGYINGVRTFSGVCHTEQGDYIFSILTSGGSSRVRTGINDIAKAIIDSY